MENKRTAVCPVCGKSFEKVPGAAFDLCPVCVKQTAERYAPPADVVSPPRRRVRWALWAVLIVGAGIVAAQREQVRTALKQMRPGIVAPDPAEECVARLWEASALIQEGRWPAGAPACPASRAPYLSVEKDGDLVVSCPNPSAHGFSSARVSRRVPTPEIVRP